MTIPNSYPVRVLTRYTYCTGYLVQRQNGTDCQYQYQSTLRSRVWASDDNNQYEDDVEPFERIGSS